MEGAGAKRAVRIGRAVRARPAAAEAAAVSVSGLDDSVVVRVARSDASPFREARVGKSGGQRLLASPSRPLDCLCSQVYFGAGHTRILVCGSFDIFVADFGSFSNVVKFRGFSSFVQAQGFRV